MKRIAIIGAGISGLVNAYLLSQKLSDTEIVIYEKETSIGGLAKTFSFAGETVENYYHYYLPYDTDLIEFTKTLGIKINWKQIDIGYFINNRIHNYNNIPDILTFPELSVFNRCRNLIGTGMLVQLIKMGIGHFWNAEKTMKRVIGHRNYTVLWQRLVEKKFHDFSSVLTLNWLIYRIIRVSERQPLFKKYFYGYVDGQLKTLTDRLLQDLQRPGITLKCNSPVTRIDKQGDGFTIHGASYDAVISTVSLNILKDLIGNLHPGYSQTIAHVDYIDLVIPVFITRKKLTPYFWLNISTDDFLYPGIVEYTNLNTGMWREHGYSLLYFPFYLTKDMEHQDDDFYIRDALNTVQKISPDFTEDDIVKTYCFREFDSQAISDSGFYTLNLDVSTPVKNLFISDSALFQPGDRAISEFIKLAYRIQEYF